MSAATVSFAAITTGRLHLRAPVASDAEAIARGLQDWEVAKNLARVPWPYERADADAFLVQVARWHAEDSERTFVIDDGRFCGVIGLRDYRRGAARVGYWLARAAWGRGYATEAAVALTDYAFATLGARSVSAAVMVDNPASMRVLEKAGFTRRCGTTCETLARGDQAAIDFSVTRAEWQRR